MSRAVFLDRDGVINRVVVRDGRPSPPSSVKELQLLRGVAEAIRTLRAAGFRIIVVTNQPDVRTGRQPRRRVEAIHQWIRRELPIDDIKACYHVDEDRCGCRKPKPGMLLEAAAEWSIDLGRSFMIGDRWRDIEAGRAAGCKTILVRSYYNEPSAERPDAVVHSLLEAVELIVSGQVARSM